MSKHTKEELKQLQSLPLNIKVRMTENRIRSWVDEFGADGVYISFSGGKDSTVLVDIVDKLLDRIGIDRNQIPLVFVDTGLEYPEIRQFVKLYGDRVTWVRPEMNFKQVIEKYGYPFFGKETAEVVYNAKRYLKSVADGGGKYKYHYERLTGQGKYSSTYGSEQGVADAKYRKLCGLGEFSKGHRQLENAMSSVDNVRNIRNTHKKKLGIIPKDGEPSRAKYSQVKYQFMLNAPFDISHMCCNVMKKKPVHKYAKETGRKPITAQMAEESMLRTQKWLQNGCNSFEGKNPISNPMSFWTNQDVLRYIKENDLPICSVYGDVIEEGQYNLFDNNLELKTTGCNRTGCMFCGFGCQLEKPHEARFVLMKKTHPKQYDYIMKPWEDGGLNYKNIIDWINEHGDMNIKY